MAGKQDNDFTKILGWPAYRVFQHGINETAKTLRFGVVEAINGNVKALVRRGAATQTSGISCGRPSAWPCKTEFIAVKKAA